MIYLPNSSLSLCLSCIESPAISTPLILILEPGVPAFIETSLSFTVMIACSLLILKQKKQQKQWSVYLNPNLGGVNIRPNPTT